jgi:hypothetical protein
VPRTAPTTCSRWRRYLREHFARAGIPPLRQVELVAGLRDDIVHDHLVRDAMDDLLAAGRVDEAAGLVLRHRDQGGSTQWRGHRVLLQHWAEHGDVDAFLATLPRCNGRQWRHEIDRARGALVVAVARMQGWEAALALTRRRQVGERFVGAALVEHVPTLGWAGARAFFAEHPDLVQDDLDVELAVEAFLRDERREEHVAEAFAVVDALDRDVKDGVLRRRDWALVRLGSALDDPAWVRRLRKAVVSPRMKKELTLHLEHLARGEPHDPRPVLEP